MVVAVVVVVVVCQGAYTALPHMSQKAQFTPRAHARKASASPGSKDLCPNTPAGAERLKPKGAHLEDGYGDVEGPPALAIRPRANQQGPSKPTRPR